MRSSPTRCTRKRWCAASSSTSGNRWLATVTSGCRMVTLVSEHGAHGRPGSGRPARRTRRRARSASSVRIALNTCRSALGSSPSIVTETCTGTTLSSRPCTSSAGWRWPYLVFGDTELGSGMPRVEEHGAVGLVGAVGDAGLIPDRDEIVGDDRRIDREVVAQQWRIRHADGSYSRSAQEPVGECHADAGCAHQHHLGDPVRAVVAICSAMRPPSELPTREVFSMPCASRNAQTWSVQVRSE